MVQEMPKSERQGIHLECFCSDTDNELRCVSTEIHPIYHEGSSSEASSHSDTRMEPWNLLESEDGESCPLLSL